MFEKCTIDRGRSKEDYFEGIVSHRVAEHETSGCRKEARREKDAEGSHS